MGPTTTGPWVGIVNAAIPKFSKTLVDLSKVKHIGLEFMKSRGLIRTGVDGGYEERYLIDYKNPPVTEFRHGTTATYEARDYTKWAVRDWRGKKATDSMHEDEVIKIRGSQTAIVNRWKRIIPKLITGVRDDIAGDFFEDGDDATAAPQTFRGIESLCGAGTSGDACVVGDLVATPDDTYHGLETDLAQSGSWSDTMSTSRPSSVIATDWPEGNGDRDYHYWSPLLVNYASNAWGTSQVTWEDNCLRAISRTLMWMRTTQNCTGQIVGIMATDLFAGFKARLDAKMRLTQPHAEATRLGFPDALNYEGAALTTGYGVPPQTMYLFEVENTGLLFLTDKVVDTHPVQWEQHDLAWNFLALSVGDYEWRPKSIAKLYPYAAA